jgi:hypothetical protein
MKKVIAFITAMVIVCTLGASMMAFAATTVLTVGVSGALSNINPSLTPDGGAERVWAKWTDGTDSSKQIEVILDKSALDTTYSGSPTLNVTLIATGGVAISNATAKIQGDSNTLGVSNTAVTGGWKVSVPTTTDDNNYTVMAPVSGATGNDPDGIEFNFSLNRAAPTTSYQLEITPNPGVATTQPVMLNIEAKGEGPSENLQIKRMSSSTGGTAMQEWGKGVTEAYFKAEANGTYYFALFLGDAEVDKDSITLSNIVTNKPTVGTLSYSNISQDTMRVTIPFGTYNTDLWLFQDTSLPTGAGASWSGTNLTMTVKNSATTLNLVFKEYDTGNLLPVPVAIEQQGGANGVKNENVEFESWEILDYDEEDMKLRVKFNSLSGWALDSSKTGHSAKVYNLDYVDLTLDNKNQSVTFYMKDAMDTVEKVSVRFNAIPYIKSVDVANLDAKETTFTINLANWSSKYDIDKEQFDEETRANHSGSKIKLRLPVEDQYIEVVATDEFENEIEMEYNVMIDELKRGSRIKVSNTTVLEVNNTEKTAKVQVDFSGVDGLEMELEKIDEDFSASKVDDNTATVVLPWGEHDLTFSFYDEDNDYTFDIDHTITVGEDTTAGLTVDSAGSVTNVDLNGAGDTVNYAPNLPVNSQTGGEGFLVNRLKSLLK